jgi:D-threo-aldose 1-dehydrogenase
MRFRALSRLGLGTAPLGNLYWAVSDEDAQATVDVAFDRGVRVFDTAPLYGHGLAERRLGHALRSRPRAEIVVSTKVGRLLTPGPPDPASMFRDVPNEVPHFDFSADGVRRSLDASLDRLGLDRVDVVLVHDPDDHLPEAMDAAVPALVALRDEGVVAAIGFGMNHVEPLRRAVAECDIDVVLVAGRYTLLDQSALTSGLFDECAERNVAVMAGGVFNSGVLAAPQVGARFDYRPVDEERLGRARRMGELCAEHDTPLPAAALQLVAAHPAVTTMLIGARDSSELGLDLDLVSRPIPAELWSAFHEAGLLSPDVPTPSGRDPDPLLLASLVESAVQELEMARPHDTMMNPPIESLLERSDSKFTLVTLAAKRARQINSYFNQLGDGLGAIVPPQVASVSRKPLSIAFEEIAADKITYERTEPGQDDDVEAEVESAEEAPAE